MFKTYDEAIISGAVKPLIPMQIASAEGLNQLLKFSIDNQVALKQELVDAIQLQNLALTNRIDIVVDEKIGLTNPDFSLNVNEAIVAAIQNIPTTGDNAALLDENGKILMSLLPEGITTGGTGAVTGTSTAPILTGLNVANETQSVVITVDNYDPASIYTFDVTGGSFSRTAGVITWILPMVADSMSHKLTVTVTNPGKTPTQVFHNVNVFNIDTVIDLMVVYENASMTEMSNRNNISIVSNKLVATADTVLSIANNKVVATSTMEVGDKLLVDNCTYEVTGMQVIADGALNTSTTNSVPVLTSNTSALSTVGEVISSPTYNPNTAYNAFGSSDSVFWRAEEHSGLNTFIGFKYNTPTVVNKYNILQYVIAMDYNRVITGWKLQASNDGVTWVDLHTVSNASDFVAGVYRTYTFLNNIAYRQYRIYAIANGGGNSVVLSKLKLISTPILVSSSQPILPQFITSAKLLTKFAESNVITQDTYETDFTGVNNLEVIYEQYSLVSPSTTLTSIPTTFLNIGDIAIIGNETDGEKSITVTASNYISSILDISSLSFTVVPTYGYRKDAKLQVTIGDLALEASGRVDTVLTSPLFITHGDYNPSTTSKVPVLTGPTAKVTGSTVYASAGYELWRAFDENNPCLFYQTLNPWVAYDFTTPVSINKYAVTTKIEWGVPTAWAFSGSDDGTNWVTLDSRSNIPWTTSFQTKWFTFNNHTKYRYYRLQITAAANVSGAIIITSDIIGLYALIMVEAETSPKMQIKAKYSDIITSNSARTMKFRVKLNRIDDAVSKISATLQKL